MASRGLVYVAGPFSKGDTIAHIAQAADIGTRLFVKGFTPIIPHLTYQLQWLYPDVWNYDSFLAYDFELIKKCDALFTLPGESQGTEREIELAIDEGIPVYTKLSELFDAFGA